VEDVKPVLLNKNWISTGNHFEEEDFYRMNCEIGDIIQFDSSRAGYHLGYLSVVGL
jgi:hypothetical protein